MIFSLKKTKFHLQDKLLTLNKKENNNLLRSQKKKKINFIK